MGSPNQGLINQSGRSPLLGEPTARVVWTPQKIADYLLGGVLCFTRQSEALSTRRSGGVIVIALPPDLHDIATTRLMGEGSDLSIAEHIVRHNPWRTLRADNEVRIVRIEELQRAGERGGMRSVTYRMSRDYMLFPVRYPVLNGFPERRMTPGWRRFVGWRPV